MPFGVGYYHVFVFVSKNSLSESKENCIVTFALRLKLTTMVIS